MVELWRFNDNRSTWRNTLSKYIIISKSVENVAMTSREDDLYVRNYQSDSQKDLAFLENSWCNFLACRIRIIRFTVTCDRLYQSRGFNNPNASHKISVFQLLQELYLRYKANFFWRSQKYPTWILSATVSLEVLHLEKRI